MTFVYAVVLIVDLLLALLGGWLLTYLWQWFIVPTFGLLPLTVVQAAGFVLIVNFLIRPALISSIGDLHELVIDYLTMSLSHMFAIFGFGYLLSFFMISG